MTKNSLTSTKLINFPQINFSPFFEKLADFGVRLVSVGDFVSAFRLRL